MLGLGRLELLALLISQVILGLVATAAHSLLIGSSVFAPDEILVAISVVAVVARHRATTAPRRSLPPVKGCGRGLLVEETSERTLASGQGSVRRAAPLSELEYKREEEQVAQGGVISAPSRGTGAPPPSREAGQGKEGKGRKGSRAGTAGAKARAAARSASRRDESGKSGLRRGDPSGRWLRVHARTHGGAGQTPAREGPGPERREPRRSAEAQLGRAAERAGGEAAGEGEAGGRVGGRADGGEKWRRRRDVLASSGRFRRCARAIRLPSYCCAGGVWGILAFFQ